MYFMVIKKIFCIRESCDRKNREYNYIVISKELIKLNIKLKFCLFVY